MDERQNERQQREQRLPVQRQPIDRIAEAGKRLRDRLDALRPHSDLKR